MQICGDMCVGYFEKTQNALPELLVKANTKHERTLCLSYRVFKKTSFLICSHERL